jgi:hypothetical protein
MMNEVSQQSQQMIVFDDVSKFYGEILGVNRVWSGQMVRARRR